MDDYLCQPCRADRATTSPWSGVGFFQPTARLGFEAQLNHGVYQRYPDPTNHKEQSCHIVLHLQPSLTIFSGVNIPITLLCSQAFLGSENIVDSHDCQVKLHILFTFNFTPNVSKYYILLILLHFTCLTGFNKCLRI